MTNLGNHLGLCNVDTPLGTRMKYLVLKGEAPVKVGNHTSSVQDGTKGRLVGAEAFPRHYFSGTIKFDGINFSILNVKYTILIHRSV